MRRGLFIFCLSVSGLATAVCDEAFVRQIRPLLEERCLTCHSTAEQEGDLDLERFATVEDISKDPSVWEQVLEQIHLGEMPPKKEPQLTPEQEKLLTGWVQGTLDAVALANAGDPGPVVIRRLSNHEYTYTIRDLTGVDGLDPAREFPVDGAAGEGFTNAGAALVMSPALLTKYLDAAKEVADHMVLTPTGIRFSAGTSSRDATDETLASIRAFYAKHTGTGESSETVGQGIKLDMGTGSGRLPLAPYLDALQGRRGTDGLSPKYLQILREALTSTQRSALLDPLRVKFQAGQLAPADIEPWQKALWRFAVVGHIGKVGGPKSWLEPVTPLAAEHEFRLKLQPPADGGDLTLYLSASDAGDGGENDFALWENARLITPGRGELLLRDVRSVLQQMDGHRDAVSESAVRCLAAASEAEGAKGQADLAALAEKHKVDAKVLAGWLNHLGIGGGGDLKLEPLLTKKAESVANYNFIKGWVGENALSVLANSSDTTVRIPGEMKPHSIATHPSPKLASVIAWRSPVAGSLKISGSVQDGHTDCGNGILYTLELRRGQTREVLAAGESKAGMVIPMGPFENVPVMPGDVVALVIDPRAGNHTCDHTPVNLTLSDGQSEWDLGKDVSPDILASNPHADRHGNSAVWHFLSQPASGADTPSAPMDDQSLLSKWRKAKDASERAQIAAQVQQLLQQEAEAAKASPADRELRRQLLDFNGPLLAEAWRSVKAQPAAATASPYGLAPALFGKHPQSGEVAATSLCVRAPSVLEMRLPAALLTGAELVATGRLHPASGGEASVQMQVLTTKPTASLRLHATTATSKIQGGAWTDSKPPVIFDAPVLVRDGSEARRRFEKAFNDFRALFPAALCYTKIVPVDEVVTLTLFHREDDQLRRLILDDAQTTELDRLWDELHFVSESPLTKVDAFEQIWEYSTQDGPNAPNGDKRLEPLREPILRDAAAFRKLQIEVEPNHVQAVLDFAAQAWRRPLEDAEGSGLTSLYQTLRDQDLSHPTALRLLLARVLVAPAFLYRGEQASPGVAASPVTDFEMATRLSYFLWASTPDAELLALAAAGKLQDPDTLAAQARRMLKSGKVDRLATEFGCQWLHVRDVATLEEKSERHFPEFSGLRGDMQEEVARFFVDLFQNDRAVLSLLDADHTFVSPALAEYYGLAAEGGDWRRVEGLRARGRGGILGFAATLAKHSGASRTSPILRGTWLSEVILGDKLPNPPTGVPVLPEETPEGLTERQLTERHSSDERCAGCHKRVDPFGFALEGFDAVGRSRAKDAAGLAIDTKTELPDGTGIEGLDGLRAWLLTERRDEFVRQFCRKMLGYALGRGVQLSDKPLIDAIIAKLETNDHRVGIVIEEIVKSPQFREVRGRDFMGN
jgi:hypothetical protein